MSTLVENNNSAIGFNQVWPEFVYTDTIPSTAPVLEDDVTSVQILNKDNSICTIQCFYKDAKDGKGSYPYIVHVSNVQLSKEYRQENIWKFIFDTTNRFGPAPVNGDVIDVAFAQNNIDTTGEEIIRRIIFPGRTTDRSYTPQFSTRPLGKDTTLKPLEYTYLNPVFDLRDCRIYTTKSFNTLYFSGWLYVGKSLKDFISDGALPFDDQLWLLKHEDGNRARLEVTTQTTDKVYPLPPDLNFEDPPEDFISYKRNSQGKLVLDDNGYPIPLHEKPSYKFTNDYMRFISDQESAHLILQALQKAGKDPILTMNSMNAILYEGVELDAGVYW